MGRLLIFSAVWLLMIVLFSSDVRGGVVVEGVQPHVAHPNMRHTGEMPHVSGLADISFSDEINARILGVYESLELLALSLDAFRLDFDFDYVSDGANHFIKIYAVIEAAGESRLVETIGFDAQEGAFLTPEDFLGANATELANLHISAHMRQNPGLFNSEFGGLAPNPGFYAADGHVIFLFDQSEIAPARHGITRIDMHTDLVRNVSFADDDYITVTDFMVKMVPLRKAAEELGFAVEWNPDDNSAKITGGSVETRIFIDRNAYDVPGRPGNTELEAAPLLHGGLTFVPVSFFDAVLGARHSTDDQGVVTISIYS